MVYLSLTQTAPNYRESIQCIRIQWLPLRLNTSCSRGKEKHQTQNGEGGTECWGGAAETAAGITEGRVEPDFSFLTERAESQARPLLKKSGAPLKHLRRLKRDKEIWYNASNKIYDLNKKVNIILEVWLEWTWSACTAIKTDRLRQCFYSCFQSVGDYAVWVLFNYYLQFVLFCFLSCIQNRKTKLYTWDMPKLLRPSSPLDNFPFHNQCTRPNIL